MPMSSLNNTEPLYVNKQYKDRLFKLVFKEKKDLLELYNAINDTDYNNPDDIEINTIEDVVYMGMKNDVSFLICDILNLYEHQSTFSPNLPLRGLFYFARLYQKMIGNEKKLYSSKKIELPYPQFIVFYNGTAKEPERQVLELSSLFPNEMSKENAAIQCRAVVLNVNLGYNKHIMEKCKMLREYAQFIASVRSYLAKGHSVELAIDMATDECIHNGILEQILKDNRGEVRSMILTEYDEQAHIEYEKEISYEEGKAEGLKQGKDGVLKLIQLLLSAGRVEDVDKITKDKLYCSQLLKEFKIE